MRGCSLSITWDISRLLLRSSVGTRHFSAITNEVPLIVVVDLVKGTSVAYGDARIVVTSSIGYKSATGIDYTALTTARPGDGDSVWDVVPAFSRYGHSKLANIYFTNELDSQLRQEGYKNIYCNSCHPGKLCPLCPTSHDVPPYLHTDWHSRFRRGDKPRTRWL